jgi:hypothetical protein
MRLASSSGAAGCRLLGSGECGWRAVFRGKQRPEQKRISFLKKMEGCSEKSVGACCLRGATHPAHAAPANNDVIFLYIKWDL